MFIHQQECINVLVATFKMPNCKSVEMPCQSGVYLMAHMCPTTAADKADMERVPCAELVVKLNWLSGNTRSHISTAVGT